MHSKVPGQLVDQGAPGESVAVVAPLPPQAYRRCCRGQSRTPENQDQGWNPDTGGGPGQGLGSGLEEGAGGDGGRFGAGAGVDWASGEVQDQRGHWKIDSDGGNASGRSSQKKVGPARSLNKGQRPTFSAQSLVAWKNQAQAAGSNMSQRLECEGAVEFTFFPALK
ncbi:hypothetical protein BY996DRAFT_6565182 [Phakopsora pachyrhizi]|nr:hypothetical protein BY996DRAFT_6565182 [Phakopsora pachyrhizi]